MALLNSINQYNVIKRLGFRKKKNNRLLRYIPENNASIIYLSPMDKTLLPVNENSMIS